MTLFSQMYRHTVLMDCINNMPGRHEQSITADMAAVAGMVDKRPVPDKEAETDNLMLMAEDNPVNRCESSFERQGSRRGSLQDQIRHCIDGLPNARYGRLRGNSCHT